MGLSITRFVGRGKSPEWGVVRGDQVYPLENAPWATSELIQKARSKELVPTSGRPLALQGLELLPVVTQPCQIICQGKNYADHALETGVRPEDRTFNIFFVKAPSTLAPAKGALRRPPEVRLLDYEVELGIVVGKPLRGPVQVTPANLGEYVGALVLANDVSARDVQVPEGQWFRGKSFRGFCPVGPWLFIPEPKELERLSELELELSVNGQLRQKGRVSSQIYGPCETLTQLSGTLDLEPGDLLLTGTPGGVAMGMSAEWNARVKAGEFKDERAKNAAWVEDQLRRPNYLKKGDRIVSRIRTADGVMDLGTQELVVEGELGYS